MPKLNLNQIKRDAIIIEEADLSYIDGKYLRFLRTKMQMSQSLFASYFGVSKNTINKWENEITKINPTAIRLIYLVERKPEIFTLLKSIKSNSM